MLLSSEDHYRKTVIQLVELLGVANNAGWEGSHEWQKAIDVAADPESMQSQIRGALIAIAGLRFCEEFEATGKLEWWLATRSTMSRLPMHTALENAFGEELPSMASQEWLKAGVPIVVAESWAKAGVWRATVATQAIEAGIRPDELVRMCRNYAAAYGPEEADLEKLTRSTIDRLCSGALALSAVTQHQPTDCSDC